MDPFTIALLGGTLLGAGKTAVDASGRSSDKKVQATTTRYSPWTGMKGAEPRQVDPVGNIMKGGLTGAMVANAGVNSGWWGPGAAPAAGAAAATAAPKYGLVDQDMYSSWPGMSRGMAGY